MTPWVLAGCAYVLGSIPTGLWLGKVWKGIDVRQHGSGNLGATNVFRVLGLWPGLLTLMIDIGKGFFPVYLAQQFFPGRLVPALGCGIAAIVGHAASFFVGFKGGKGVATSAGVFVALLPIPCLVAMAAFSACFAGTRYVSVGSMAGALALAISSFWSGAPTPLSWSATVLACFVFWTHRTNIRRLLDGTENRITFSRRPG